jgi:hypothetical protein
MATALRNAFWLAWFVDILVWWLHGVGALCAAAGAVKDATPASSATAVAQAVIVVVMIKGPLLVPRRR